MIYGFHDNGSPCYNSVCALFHTLPGAAGPTPQQRQAHEAKFHELQERVAEVESRVDKETPYVSKGEQSSALPHFDPMPIFTIKAKDRLALETIAAYRQLCVDNGLLEQAIEVTRAYVEINRWQQRNQHLIKYPDHTHIPVTGATQ